MSEQISEQLKEVCQRIHVLSFKDTMMLAEELCNFVNEDQLGNSVKVPDMAQALSDLSEVP